MVKVLSGKDRGKTGKVVQVLYNTTTATRYVVVEGVNILKKHIRGSARARKGDAQKGQVIELPAPIHMSSVALIDPKSGNSTRVGYRVEGDTKKRVARRSGEMID